MTPLFAPQSWWVSHPHPKRGGKTLPAAPTGVPATESTSPTFASLCPLQRGREHAPYSVTVKADDNNGGTDTIAVTINVTDVDEPPAAPTVSPTAGSITSLDVRWAASSNTGPPTPTATCAPPTPLVRIALYLCGPRLNKLEGVTCGPVSQTRVCDTTQPGRGIHMERSGADPKLVEDRPAQVLPPGQADRIQPPNISYLPPTRSTLAPLLTALCDLRAAGDRGPCTMREWSSDPWRKTSTLRRPRASSSSRWCSPSASGGGTRSGSARSRARRRRGRRGVSPAGGPA